LYIGGGEGWDGVLVSLQYFPLMVAIAAICMFLLLGIVFRSVLIPLRSIFTIGLTLLFVYGSGIQCFSAFGSAAHTCRHVCANNTAARWSRSLPRTQLAQ
jgi:hypothetical protein